MKHLRENKLKCITPFGLETKIYDAESNSEFIGYIEGLAATNHKDHYGDIIADKALIKGASDLQRVGTVFKNHNYRIEDAIGKIISAQFVKNEDLSGIKVKVGITKTEPDIWVKIKEGIINKFSIGGSWDAEWNDEMDAYYITELELFELSIVGLPANSTAEFNADNDLGNLASRYIKSLEKNHYLEKQKYITKEKNIMDEEIKERLINLEQSIKKLVDSRDKIEQKETAAVTDPVIAKLTEAVQVIAGSVEPLLTEQARKKQIAERRTAIIEKAKNELESMGFREKQTLEMRRIIEALQDPTVSEVVLLGDLNYVPPIHERSIEEILDEKRKVGI